MDDDFSKKDLQLRKKQATCKHFSYKCSCCGLYKDNLHNEYARTIVHLLKIIDGYESALGIESTLLIDNEHYCHEKVHN